MFNTTAKSLDASAQDADNKEYLQTAQLHRLKQFGSKVNEFGVSFAVCDADGELVLLCDGSKSTQTNSDAAKLQKTPAAQRYTSYAKRCLETEGGVCQLGEENPVLAVALKSGRRAIGVALLDTKSADTRCENQEVVLGRTLGLLAENLQAVFSAQEEIELVSTELAHVYEELVLLHKLSTNMKVTEPDATFLQMACDSLTDIVLVEGIAVLLEKTIENEKRLVLAAGSGLMDIDDQLSEALFSRLQKQVRNGKEALLDSQVDSPFRYDWPENIKSIIAVPLYGKGKAASSPSKSGQNGSNIIGIMTAINRLDKPDFDSTDMKLFNSVANSCAVFVENSRLFSDLKELFIGSLRALTSSIDAKDKYTRGHSERVAFVSRWIAERLHAEGLLNEEQIHRVYLAGLLHDIGKIGIDKTVLCKQGKLNEQEINRIRMHPSIGAGILGQIIQMRDIIPGVLCHHERVDGTGYPSGLAGERIPIMGKIVGLADSFDAMTSKRTYRDAMSLEQTLAEIEKGLGRQFDQKVGRVFIESDIHRLCDVIGDGFSDGYTDINFSEYGALAVGSIIR